MSDKTHRNFAAECIFFFLVALMATFSDWRLHQYLALFMWIVLTGYIIAYLLERRGDQDHRE